MSRSATEHSNRLAYESSLYLLQHAHNPVDWYPWGQEALNRAVREQKPILVSIGYAACHWCHVMERESFEDPQVAEAMNTYFVCIKVDREERPDVDQVYLDAVQAMGIQGGWPLNVFLTPDAKPFYGGTYFPASSWLPLLTSIGQAYRQHEHQELEASAQEYVRVLQASELKKYRIPVAADGLSEKEFQQLVQTLTARLDPERGGLDRTPKFPMPSVWRFLLRAFWLSDSQNLLDQLDLTLRAMACGGLYDQVGGGFARYAVDAHWLVPHFEKMLYDNAQLVSLYAEAYQLTRNPLYREVVYDTVAFVQREMLSPEGGFYSSLDADSEGEEGKFYAFTKEELQTILGDAEPLAAAYYGCNASGNWEQGRNILHRHQTDTEFALGHHLQPEAVTDMVRSWKHKLLTARATRPRPTLDDKVLTSWNGLMLQGLLDAYRAFAEPEFLALALRNAQFIREKLSQDVHLFRTYKNGKATVAAFLEDYALVIQAYIGLYEATFQEEWLEHAEQLLRHVLAQFFDPAEELFFYSDTAGEALIARKKELLDNVIPASNSVMAHNLHRLGLHLENERYLALATAMLRRVQGLLVQEPQSLSNWATLYASLLHPAAEIAIVGPEAEARRRELSCRYLAGAVLAGTTGSSQLPLLRGRTAQQGRTTLYVCIRKVCQLPVHSVAEALAQL